MLDTSLPTYVDVILPLAIPKAYTYAVPLDLVDALMFGLRVEVPLRNKLYSAIVVKIHQEKPISSTKNVVSIIDRVPIISEEQFLFWSWMAEYYCATIGEVMGVALPSGLKLASESKFLLNTGLDIVEADLTDDEYMIAEAMSIEQEITISTVQDVLGRKSVYPVIKSLMLKRVLVVKEELRERYRPKTEDFVRLIPIYKEDPSAALDLVKRSEKQSRALMAILSLDRREEHISKKAVYAAADASSTIIRALRDKGVIEVYKMEVSRLGLKGAEDLSLTPLSPAQEVAHAQVVAYHEDSKVALLHGVTGSGKTRIYIDLILETLAAGKQVLLMLPEIALTTQIVARLKSQIGDQLYVYHSKINDHERVEIWQAAMHDVQLFVGARSAIFLPFADLGLIIVDEEHDTSYKQTQPSPRYHGRDAAIMLARLYDAKVVLGSATPSLESMHNCQSGKYGLVPLTERYGQAQLPEIAVIDMKEAYKKGLVQQKFSTVLIDEIKETISRGDQVVLFQNRRGYAPIQRCTICDWVAECPNCDVTLTYHQAISDLKCHYCGYRAHAKKECPSCGHHELALLGSGTEQIEEIMQELIPEARVGRFDYDTTRTKSKQEEILADFRLGRINVLVGTQMITKGFDFDKIALVGIVSADSLLSYPDFRAVERTFQLLVQVAGRAGRREKMGKVFIQTFQTNHPVLKDVINYDDRRYFTRELIERKQFVFPPYYNLIAIWIRHYDLKKTKAAAQRLSKMLSAKLGSRVQGAVDPPVIRIRNQYQQLIYVKVEKEAKVIRNVKYLIREAIKTIKTDKEVRQVAVSIDVDPY